MRPLASVALRGAGVIAAALALSAAQPAAAAKSREEDCSAKKTALARALCGDPELGELDKWAKSAYRAALAEADRPGRAAVEKDQKAFAKERNECLPRSNAVEAASSGPKTSEAEGASISELPPPRPDGAVPVSPNAGLTNKLVEVPPPPPKAAEPEEPETNPLSPDEILGCLRTTYTDRIKALESKLRRFVDLSADVPSAGSVCQAVGALQQQGNLRVLSRHALVMTLVDEATEMHPSRKREHLARYLSASADRSAASSVPGWTGPLGSVSIYRVGLVQGQPPDWVFSTITGDSRDRSVLLFEGDTTTADRMSGFVGGPGAGKFDPTFIRFKGQPYAVVQSGPAYSTAPMPGIFALDQSKPVCGAR